MFLIVNQKDNDILYINGIREGDEKAFKLLFDKYFIQLCRFMSISVHRKMLVEEEALDIFIYIWVNRRTIQIHSSVKSYLFRAARNKCLNILRQDKQTFSIEDINCEFPSQGASSLESDELSLLVQEAIMSLPEKCKKIFVLSRVESIKNKDIAEQLDISLKAVEAQITRALKHLKKHLKGCYIFF